MRAAIRKEKFMRVFKGIIFVFIFFINTAQANTNLVRQPVDIVFALDLSASTNGLIEDMRDKIWDIANQMKQLRPEPDLRIGVVCYGRPSFGYYNQFVKVISPLTNDYDFLADELYKIKPIIEKGDQYVGAAMRASIELMNWSAEENAVKEIFIVGNGMVNLGTFAFRESCELAKERGIKVNAVYCMSNLRQMEVTGWMEIAELCESKFYEIKVHRNLPAYRTVEDLDKLKQLAKQLSSTYIYYGKEGYNRYKMMANNDKNALKSGQATFEAMLIHKISEYYQGKQYSWDLIDNIKSRKGDLSVIESQFLSDTIRKHNPEQLRNYLETVKENRIRIINLIRPMFPAGRQERISSFNEKFADEGKMVLERVVMTHVTDLLKERGITR